MTPIAQNVPVEVIHQIFAPFATTLRTDNLTAFPWFLGHICSTWRSVFRSMTAEFWYTISISFEKDDKDGEDQDCYFSRPIKCSRHIKCVVQFFLERDPAAPLSFALVASERLSQQDQDRVHPIMKMLIDESMRWKDVSFQCSYLNLTQFVRTKYHLPLLQKLHLTIKAANNLNAKLSPVFETAPSLNVIEFGTFGDWKFVWSNLKDITLGYTDSAFYNALPHMTNLERLHVRYEGIYFNGSTTIVSLPRLTSLRCDPNLLRVIKAPQLEDFTIGSNYLFQPSIVLSFLRKSSCNILCLNIRRAEAATVIMIIQGTPQITRLMLADIPHVERVLEMLIISCQESLARHILSLHIQDSYVKDAFETEVNMLSRLIVSRARVAGGYRYERLQRLCTFGLPDAAATKLTALCKECKVEYENEWK
ncbi:hypothetical protein APHAL10511_008542 [Amanita phalloides]|nr:hypothetical protein APHAL10511_008542 [Amanita phalloides]